MALVAGRRNAHRNSRGRRTACAAYRVPQAAEMSRGPSARRPIFRRRRRAVATAACGGRNLRTPDLPGGSGRDLRHAVSALQRAARICRGITVIQVDHDESRRQRRRLFTNRFVAS